MKNGTVHESVKEYYGSVLQSNGDLQSNACCAVESYPDYIRDILGKIHTEVHMKFYGCGSPIPLALEGCTILDLGSGTGRDCFVASKLVGPTGRVIGIDMTDEQLDIAKEYIDYHTDRFGYKKPNVEFRKGLIEDLSEAGIESNSVDVVISNCVINLSPNKEKVFSEIFRVLKPGGELYFSDVFASQRIPVELQSDPVLYGECLAGALYFEDFRRLLLDLGCPDYRVVSSSLIAPRAREVEEKIGMIDFSSITVRAFKLDDLEDRCEDYGQVAYYRGTIPHSPHRFALDDHHLFKSHQPFPVCGNTASMLANTRYSKHFEVTGNRSQHFGLFPCGDKIEIKDTSNDGACC